MGKSLFFGRGIILLLTVLISLSFVQGYAKQCIPYSPQSWWWLGVHARSMESVAFTCADSDSWGYLEYSVNGAYGGIRNIFNAPSTTNWNWTQYTYPLYAEYTAPFSNGSLYTVVYMKDYLGSAYHVVPPRYLPNAPGGEFYYLVDSSWTNPGLDWTRWYLQKSGQPNYILRYSTAESLTIPPGTSSSSHAPMYSQIVYWDACDFSCLTWQDCQVNDTYTCLVVSDGNSTGYCPTAYDADYQEFITACDYCTPDWECSNYTECGDGWQNCTAVIDVNDCFAQTGLPADEFGGNLTMFGAACGAPLAEGGAIHNCIIDPNCDPTTGQRLVKEPSSVITGQITGIPALGPEKTKVLIGGLLALVIGYIFYQNKRGKK